MHESQKGIVVTVGEFTADAKEFAGRNWIEIVDEKGIQQMIQSAGGMENEELRRFFEDTRKVCPKCESEMILRTARKGLNAGGTFWGCSRYPRCNFILKT